MRVEAAALAAALELDGTPDAFGRARTAAQSDATPETVEFGDGTGWWTEPPADKRVTMVRVTAASTLPLTLVRTVVQQREAQVRVRATARMATAEGTPAEVVR